MDVNGSACHADRLTEEQELCLLFTKAIARPGTTARLITESNAGGDVTSIEEAVRSDRAFMVTPREGIIAVDLDDEPDHGWAARARVSLETAGCRIVMTHSGRPGHSHMWIVAPPGWDNEYTKDRLYEAGGPEYLELPGKGRSQGRANATRPPFAPHRDPSCGRSTLGELGFLTALDAFRMAQPRDISGAARERLERFDPSTAVRDGRGRPSRSLTLRSVAVAFVNARQSFESFQAAMRDAANETARLYFEDYPKKLHDGWLESAWGKAKKWVRENPSRPSSEVARETVTCLLACVNDHSWPSRTGANDRAVYRALLSLAHDAGTTSVGASARHLSRVSGVARNGVSRALGRLCERGLIRRLGNAQELAHNRRCGRADTYALCVVTSPSSGGGQGCPPGGPCRGSPEAGASGADADEEHTKSVVAGDTTDLLIGDRRFLVSRSTALLLQDLFTNGGLGLSCRETWEALPTTPTKTADVAGLRPGNLKPSTVRQHLKTLTAHGLADRDGHRWWRLLPPDDSLRFSLDILGVRNKTAGRVNKYARESSEYQKHQEKFGFQPPEKKDRGTAA